MRGCCHRPGVEAAGEGCCVGVLVAGVLYLVRDWGVWTPTGKATVVEVGDGMRRCVGEEMRLLPLPEVVRVRLLREDGERTREVVDIVVSERWWWSFGEVTVVTLCCAVKVSS